MAFLGDQLNRLGIRLTEARVIPDDVAAIVSTVNEVRGCYDYVFTTGGIGPTHDDITADCIARAFGVPLTEHPEARAILDAHYKPGDLNDARLRMARTPQGASLIGNPISSAPGFQIGNVFVMAGIPSVMRAMFGSLSHRLTGGTPLLSKSVVAALPEGLMAGGLGAIQARYRGLVCTTMVLPKRFRRRQNHLFLMVVQANGRMILSPLDSDVPSPVPAAPVG